MASVPNRSSWEARHLSRTVAFLACATLAAGGMVTVGSPAAVAFSEESAGSAQAINTTVEPTVTDVAFVEGVVAATYTGSGFVSEAEGDAQQQDAISAEMLPSLEAHATRVIAGEIDVNIARINLDSDNVMVAATWDVDAPGPQSVSLRYLQDSTWSEWTDLDAETAGGPDDGVATRAGTEPFALFNADAVEVLATDEDGTPTPGLRVVVVEADNEGSIENALTDGISEDSEQKLPGEDEEANPAATTPGNGEGEGASPAPPTDNQLSDDLVEDILLDEDGLVEVEGSAYSSPGAQPLATGVGTVGVMPAVLNPAGTIYDTGFSGLKINTRKAWGADESWMTWTPKANNIQGAVIHHTESNGTYSPDQVAQQIRGIYRYHAVTLGWGDIGYNLIVDRFGGVWEGRAGGLTKQIHAAHAGKANANTYGITVMGSFMKDAPVAAAQDSVAKALGWKLSLNGIRAVGGDIRVVHEDGYYRNVPLISGHRDVGWTDCPGDAFYSSIPAIRTAVARYIAANSFSGTVTRLGGSDRYATNRAVNAASTTTGKPVFVVAGQDYADALTASPAAAKVGGSLFLVRSSGLDQATSAAILAKKPSEIYIVGGAGSVSAEVESQLKSSTGLRPVRVCGSDRYETSAAIMEKFFGAGTYSKVFIATGADFPDALTAAAAAGALGVPVALVNGSYGALPAKTKTVLNRGTKGKTLLAVGGEAVVTPAALATMKEAVPGSNVARLGGKNRYSTSLAVNDYVSANGGSTPTKVWIATGMDFPDALSAATSAGAPVQRLFLSSKSCIPAPVVSKWISPSSSSVRNVTLVGSTGTLYESVEFLTECG